MTRNPYLILQQRQGILSAFLATSELEKAAHESIEWSDQPRGKWGALWNDEAPELRQLKGAHENDLRSIKILDSFFSDTLTGNDIRIPIFKRALEGVPVQFLLADPRGAFGTARAKAIGQEPMSRSVEGLRQLAKICNQERCNRGDWESLEFEIMACKNGDDWNKIAALLLKAIDSTTVEVRLYQESPVAPLYFFGDLLFVGRFWTGLTAANFPWEHIIDTPIPGDLFDIMTRQFYATWRSAKCLKTILGEQTSAMAESRNKPPKIFISCCEADKSIVADVERRLKKNGILYYLFMRDLITGEVWDASLRRELEQCDALLAVVSDKSALNSEWLRAEIGAAWVLGKLLLQANVGVDRLILDGIMDKRWSIDIASDGGKDRLIRDIKQHFRWEMPSTPARIE